MVMFTDLKSAILHKLSYWTCFNNYLRIDFIIAIYVLKVAVPVHFFSNFAKRDSRLIFYNYCFRHVGRVVKVVAFCFFLCSVFVIVRFAMSGMSGVIVQPAR